MEFDLVVNEKSINELADLVHKGDAFIIWASGLSKKQIKKLEKNALAWLLNKKTPLKMHIVHMQCGKEFRIIE